MGNPSLEEFFLYAPGSQGGFCESENPYTKYWVIPNLRTINFGSLSKLLGRQSRKQLLSWLSVLLWRLVSMSVGLVSSVSVRLMSISLRLVSISVRLVSISVGLVWISVGLVSISVGFVFISVGLVWMSVGLVSISVGEVWISVGFVSDYCWIRVN